MIDFITGNKFKSICHYHYDDGKLIKLSDPKNEVVKIFVKIDLVHQFFTQKQDRDYILFTHNGDYPIDSNFLKYMDDPHLLKWYGQNVMTTHPKLVSIPIGIANEIWPHGNEKIFNEVIHENLPKNRLVYVNFNIRTNLHERFKCMTQIEKNGLSMSSNVPFKEYLRELSQSYFVISPNGNGIDCHKTWEALYVRTIPIVTKSINVEFYRNYPIIVLDSWSKFNANDFNIELYNKTWQSFDVTKLKIDAFI